MKWIAILLVVCGLAGCKRMEPTTTAGKVEAVFTSCIRHTAALASEVDAGVVRECRMLAENAIKNPVVLLDGVDPRCPEPKENQ